MRSVLLTVGAHVGHVAIDASDARVGVHAVRPAFKVRVLNLQHTRAAVGVRPVAREAFGVSVLIIFEFGFGIEPVGVGHVNASVFGGEEIFGVALTADVGAHLVMSRLAHVDAHFRHRFDEALVVNAQLHGVGVVAA